MKFIHQKPRAKCSTVTNEYNETKGTTLHNPEEKDVTKKALTMHNVPMGCFSVPLNAHYCNELLIVLHYYDVLTTP